MALTLTIIGGYLRDAYGGDIRQRDRIKLAEADAEEQGGHAFRAMDAYAEWFDSDGEGGQRALAVLRLLGLFDRPADAGCLASLWRAPPVDGLTEPLIALSEAQRNIVLTRLASAKLVTVNRAGGSALVSLDAHPLLREYFAKDLREKRHTTCNAGHKRLYEHLTTTTPDMPAPTLDDLQPLYQAVRHGCLAGTPQEACEKVYRDRIQRGTGSGGFYSTTKLGAFGAGLGAVTCFFDLPWSCVLQELTPPAQAWLLGQAAHQLRSLGRLSEALEPMRASLNMYVTRDWRYASLEAGNLSELELTLGDVGAAIRDGEASVALADHKDDASQRVISRSTYADALHQAGRKAEAGTLFAKAEAMQVEDQPGNPLLYSARGFWYCDLLLADTERAAWRFLAGDGQPATRPLTEACRAVAQRATQTLSWFEGRNSLLTIGLDHLTLARAALYATVLDGQRPRGDHLREAADLLRHAGAQEYLLRVLVTRALFLASTDAFDAARNDLDEAYEIAERGPMRLFLADIHLHRARLFGLMDSRPVAYPGPRRATVSTPQRNSSTTAAMAAAGRN